MVDSSSYGVLGSLTDCMKGNAGGDYEKVLEMVMLVVQQCECT